MLVQPHGQQQKQQNFFDLAAVSRIRRVPTTPGKPTFLAIVKQPFDVSPHLHTARIALDRYVSARDFAFQQVSVPITFFVE